MNELCLLILEDSGKSDFGGGQRVTLSVMEALYGKIRLVLFDTEKETTFRCRSMKYIHDFISLKTHTKIGNRGVASFNISFGEILSAPLQFLKNYYRIKKFIKATGSENQVMYATTKKTLIYAYLINKSSGVPYVFHAHSSEGGWLSKLMRPLYNNASCIICVSDFIRSRLNHHNAITIYNPVMVSTEVLPRRLKYGEKIVVASFSRLLKWKGIAYFMDSYKLLEHKHIVEYSIFGEGPEHKVLEALENDRVKLKGFAADTNNELKHIDLVVVPSIAEESFGITSIEAFSMGIPVITTDIGGQAEVVKEGEVGLHVPVKDSQAIADKIDYFINHPEVYHQMSVASLAYVKRFDAKQFEIRIREVFNNLYEKADV